VIWEIRSRRKVDRTSCNTDVNKRFVYAQIMATNFLPAAVSKFPSHEKECRTQLLRTWAMCNSLCHKLYPDLKYWAQCLSLPTLDVNHHAFGIMLWTILFSLQYWRKLHNEELRLSYTSPIIGTVTKSRRARWMGYVVCLGKWDFFSSEFWWYDPHWRDQWETLILTCILEDYAVA
jgi:hypothetical protein